MALHSNQFPVATVTPIWNVCQWSVRPVKHRQGVIYTRQNGVMLSVGLVHPLLIMILSQLLSTPSGKGGVAIERISRITVRDSIFP